jgi:hypothetical protein
MSKIKGKDLIKLGFEKVIEPPTLDPEDNGYHYYIYKLNNKSLLISCASDDRKGSGYSVELYEIPEISFHKLKQIKKLVKLFRSTNHE